MAQFDPDCLLCDIAQARSYVHVVAQTRSLLAFADHNPIRPGHLQIIPRAHYSCFDAIPPTLASQITRLGQRLARAIKAEYGVSRVAFVFTGHDVTHAHAHLVPIVEAGDITSRRYIAQDKIEFTPCPIAAPDILSDTARRLTQRLAEETTA